MSSAYNYPPDSASCRYEAGVTDRDQWLQKGRRYSAFTMPSICPEEGQDGSELTVGFQSVGSRGVKHLASKMLLALMPPNISFFKLSLDDADKAQLTDDPDALVDIETGLAKMENLALTWLEGAHVRVTAYEALLHLIITGNVLFRIPASGQARIYPLSQFITRRKADGSVKEVIIKEELSKDDLTAEQAEEYQLDTPDYENASLGVGKKTVCFYTCVRLSDTGKGWNVHQEVKGEPIESSRGTYPLEAPEIFPLRWRKIDGKNYGNGFVEDVIGDLGSYEGLSMSLVEGAAGISKLIFLVNPNGSTDKKDLEKDNLSIVDGKEGDVTTVQSGKTMDLSFAKAMSDTLEKRLELQFLLNTAVQRDAERVTAEEIRYVAQELEDTLGGQYSILSLEFQVPIAHRVVSINQKAGKLPVLPKDLVKIKVIAGLEALGRGHELARLEQFISGLGQLVGPAEVPKYVNMQNYLKRKALGLALDTTGLLKTDEQRAAEAQQQQQNALQQRVGPEVIKQAGAAVQAEQPQQTPQG